MSRDLEQQGRELRRAVARLKRRYRAQRIPALIWQRLVAFTGGRARSRCVLVGVHPGHGAGAGGDLGRDGCSKPVAECEGVDDAGAEQWRAHGGSGDRRGRRAGARFRMIGSSRALRVWAFAQGADLRKGFDGCAAEPRFDLSRAAV